MVQWNRFDHDNPEGTAPAADQPHGGRPVWYVDEYGVGIGHYEPTGWRDTWGAVTGHVTHWATIEYPQQPPSVDLIFGPWRRVSVYAANNDTPLNPFANPGQEGAYCTQLHKLLSIARGLTILLVQDWETLVYPVKMAELLRTRDATVRYAGDRVLRLPPVGEV
jgi:hypothetical protein